MFKPEPTVPCGTCGAKTRHRGTRRCDNCWEVERRIEDYLRGPNGRARVVAILERLGFSVTRRHAAETF